MRDICVFSSVLTAALMFAAAPAAAQVGGLRPSPSGFGVYPQYFNSYGFGLYPGYVGGRYSLPSIYGRGRLSGSSLPYYPYAGLPYYPYYGLSYTPLPSAVDRDADDLLLRYDRVSVTVHVPADAELWVEGSKTKQTGPVRVFESPPLVPGQKYRYEVRAKWTDNGKPVEQVRKVTVYAGDRVTVDFTKAE